MTAGDFEREVEAARPMLLQTARGMLGDADDAEDAAQEALLKLWGMAASLRSPLAPLAKVLVRNLCVDRLRRRRPTVSVDSVVLPESVADEAEYALFNGMMAFIDSLPAAQQVVLRLRHIDGMDYSEIARLTGGSEAAVRKMVSRARMAVRKHFINGFDDET